jgi:uncharacterized membrane protein YfcA
VRFKVALLFGGAGILTAFFGGRLAHFVAGDVLMLSFAALMILVGAVAASTANGGSAVGLEKAPRELP